MRDWIQEELERYDLKNVFITFSYHALNDKNLKPEDIDMALETVRTGQTVPEKSDNQRNNICFKRHFGDNITYFVVVGLHEGLLRVVTLWKVKGRV